MRPQKAVSRVCRSYRHFCQTPTYRRRKYLCKSFHSDMPNFDSFLFNKQNWRLSYQCIWISLEFFLVAEKNKIAAIYLLSPYW